MRGEREGNIERVRHMALLRVPVAPFFRACPPGEGRTVTRGVHHAQHRLLDVEVMMLEIMALRAPVSPCFMVVSPERAASSQRVAFALQVLHGYLLLLAPRRPRL